MKRVIIVVLLADLTIASAPASEVHSVAWFVAHPDIMRGVLRLCHNNPGEARNNPNCVNAEQAEGTVMADDWLAKFLPKGK